MVKATTRAVYRGDGLQSVISDEEYDEIVLFEYPSIQAFIEMTKIRITWKLAGFALKLCLIRDYIARPKR